MTETNKDRSNTDITETDLANQKVGDNNLQANEQANVHNQRHAMPEGKAEADDVIESFEKLDKDVRAERDVGKGNRNGKSDDS